MKSKREFILETLLPYKNDRSTCSINIDGRCVYLAKDGRMCAIGKHLKDPGEFSDYDLDVVALHKVYGLSNILTDKADSINISIDAWGDIQLYHDTLAKGEIEYHVNNIVNAIENKESIELPELYL